MKEKALELERHGSSGLYTPKQGAEKQLKECYWPSEKGSRGKVHSDFIVKVANIRTSDYYYAIKAD